LTQTQHGLHIGLDPNDIHTVIDKTTNPHFKKRLNVLQSAIIDKPTNPGAKSPGTPTTSATPTPSSPGLSSLTLNSTYLYHNNDTNTLHTLPQSYKDIFFSPPQSKSTTLTLATIQLPRLRLTLVSRYDSTGTLRLYSQNQPDLFVSDIRPTQPSFSSLFQGLPHSLLLQNHRNDFFVLVPNHPVCHNTITRAFPLDTTLILKRNDKQWQQLCPTRYYLYQIHPSLTTFYLFSTAMGSGNSGGGGSDQNQALGAMFYLFTLKFLNRNYSLAKQIAQKCIPDRPLLEPQLRYMYKSIQVTLDDQHPDAAALRLWFWSRFKESSPPIWNYSSVEKGKGNEAGGVEWWQG
jgi:hypothetical protein